MSPEYPESSPETEQPDDTQLKLEPASELLPPPPQKRLKLEAEAPLLPSSEPLSPSEVEAREPVAKATKVERTRKPETDLTEIAAELKRLHRTVQATWLLALVLAVVAFFAGKATQPAQTVIVAAPAPTATITPEEQDALDRAPAVEDELTPEEKAAAEEVISSAEPPPPPPEKKVEKKKAPPKHKLMAAATGRASDVTKSSTKQRIDPRAQQEAKVISDALGSGRGSKCRARFDAISEIVAKTRIAPHREAGIVLRARCFADTYRSDAAKNEYRRYLREFPRGKYAEEAQRILAL